MRQRIALLVALLILLVACGSGGAQNPVALTPTIGEPSEFLLLYSREGGIAGFCDTLTVRLEEAILESCRGGVTTIPIAPPLQEELQQLIQRYANFETTTEDNPGGADSMVQRLQFNGVGSEEAGDEAVASMHQLVAELMAGAISP